MGHDKRSLPEEACAEAPCRLSVSVDPYTSTRSCDSGEKNRSETLATTGRRTLAGALAQVLAQATSAWALVAHVAGWPDVSIWVVTPLAAALLVPFRHDGSWRSRAMGNFGSAAVVGGLLWWEILVGGLEGIVDGTGFTIGPVALLMLVSTILFSLAGAMFWLLRERDGQ